MNTPVAYLICRCNSCAPTYTIDGNWSQAISPSSIIFDDYTFSTLHCIKYILSICSKVPDLYYLHESIELSPAEQFICNELRDLGCTVHSTLCIDFGKTSYTRQRRHKRYLAKTDYLLIAYDKPSAEINNAIRTADMNNIPVIRFRSY